jgi:hypothetical protein
MGSNGTRNQDQLCWWESMVELGSCVLFSRLIKRSPRVSPGCLFYHVQQATDLIQNLNSDLPPVASVLATDDNQQSRQYVA